MATTIGDLPTEVLSGIICAVAKSQTGVRDVLQAMLICPRFREASDIDAVLKSVSFQNVKILGRTNLFHSTRGLLYKCAKAGNPEAVHLLAQVILASCSMLERINMSKEELKNYCCYDIRRSHNRNSIYEYDIVAPFVAHFIPNPAQEPIANSNLTFHWDYVKSFILKCTTVEIRDMGRDLCRYIKLFHDYPRLDSDALSFQTHLHMMCCVHKTLEAFSYPPEELVYSSHVEALFEEFRKKTLDAFDAMTPLLW